MTDALDIAEVARLTGLTSRTLRFYETRGLVTPLRSHNGRRYYGRDQLERINRIVALKHAGLTLAQIRRLMAERQLDLVQLVDEHLRVLEARKAEIGRAQFLLHQAVLGFDPDGPIDIAEFCARIRHGAVQQANAGRNMIELFDGIDIEGIKRSWVDLQQRIEAALPLDPASAEARALHAEVEPIFAPLFSWWKAKGAKLSGTAADLALTMKGNDWPHLSMKVWQFLEAVKRQQIKA
jgi:DNA-binding transcriptional MerR regulator